MSADLDELAARRVCMVCSGPKNILDVRLTLERLESLGVPVIGWRSEKLAGFLASTTDLPVSARADTVPELCRIIQAHWSVEGGGLVVSNPLGRDLAIPDTELQRVDEGQGVRGADLTPYLLERLRARLGERVIRANIALLEANARLAAEISVGLGSR